MQPALLDRRIDYFSAYVCENLGSPDERVTQGELAEITARVNESASKPSGDSAVYFTLSRLDGEGFILFEYIQATETQKGKVLFKVTEEGERVLRGA